MCRDSGKSNMSFGVFVTFSVTFSIGFVEPLRLFSDSIWMVGEALMKLADYLDIFSWSQKDLAKHAHVSPASVSRALHGDKVSRRIANAMAATISKELGQTVRVPDLDGLAVMSLRRRKKVVVDGDGSKPAPTPRSRKGKATQAQSRAEFPAEQS